MARKFLLQNGRKCLCRSFRLAKNNFLTCQKQARKSTNFENSSSSLSSIRYLLRLPSKPISFSYSSFASFRLFNTNSSTYSSGNDDYSEDPDQGEEMEGGETTDGWEEEDDAEPELGDGGDGGGVVLGDVPWGERALSIAREVLLNFSNDIELFSFKTSPRGYIYVRLDKLPNKYGCPSMEEIENYNCLYKKRLEEVGESGEIPDDLALEVSSPGAERILKVPNDLDRFKDMPMKVSYNEGDSESRFLQKDGVFLMESIETEAGLCVWKLADVKENRDLLGKGRPLSRKQKDWRLRLPFSTLRKVTLYLEF